MVAAKNAWSKLPAGSQTFPDDEISDISYHRPQELHLTNDSQYKSSVGYVENDNTMASQSFSNFYTHLPPPAECLAILVGFAELSIFGLAGLANPVEFANGYGLPISNTASSQDQTSAIEASSDDTKTSDDKTKQALIAAIAARNVQNGILILTLACYTRDRRSLGLAITAGLVTTVADALIVQWYGVKDKVFGHYIGVFNSFAIGGSLLYWGRQDRWY